jgi:hypothetical protein
MNVEAGAEAALFPEKEYISRISLAVCFPKFSAGIFKQSMGARNRVGIYV